MSGGYFDYGQYKISEISNQIERLLKRDYDVCEYNPLDGLSGETLKEFHTALDLLKKSFIYAHRIDWLLSGDDGEETFHKRLIEDLKDV